MMMRPVAAYAVLPLALASLSTGILQALGTPWGLFRHCWVLISLAVTGFATVVLVVHVPRVSATARDAADPATDLSHPMAICSTPADSSCSWFRWCSTSTSPED